MYRSTSFSIIVQTSYLYLQNYPNGGTECLYYSIIWKIESQPSSKFYIVLIKTTPSLSTIFTYGKSV